MHQHSAYELNQAFQKGDLSAVAIVDHYLARIRRDDARVGAFLSVCDERALHQAKAQDRRRAAGEKLGRLAGVPIGIKDNLHIKGELTTCASKFLTNYRALFTATVVEQLEQEDAIVIGKTNLDEFAMGSSCENSALQKTRNPWDLSKVPGGSSGGSAAAVAARFCPIALGSDTGGSIRQPAALCGVVGYKPTYGRVSRNGLVAFGSSFDTVGPLTYSVRDAALVMEIIGRECPMDATSLPGGPEAYLPHLPRSLSGWKIGVPRSFLEELRDEAKENYFAALEVMQSLGAELVDVQLDALKHSIAVYYVLATAEASTNLARFDGIRYGVRAKDAATLDEIYDLSKEEGYGPEVKRRILLGTYVLSSGFKEAYFRKAQKVRRLIQDAYKSAFRQCDLVAMPASPFAAFAIGAIHDPLQMYLADIYTISINLAGVPAVSVPSGFGQKGLPFGIQLIGAQRNDARVLAGAYAFEQATPYAKTVPPLFQNE